MSADDQEVVLEIIEMHYTGDAKCAEKDYRRYFKLCEEEKVLHRNYVAIVDDRVVGVSGFYVDRETDDVFWLNWTYVAPDYQRQGIGSKLLDTIQEEIRKLGARKLYVDTSDGPIYKGAVTFYERKGLKLEAELKNYFQDGETKLILGKRVASR
jgi:GNAT superfamily N-acetyltransferase